MISGINGVVRGIEAAAEGITVVGGAATAGQAVAGTIAISTEGGSKTTAGSGFKWGNPKSTPTYGHTFSQHGQKQTLQQLIDRANGFDNPHQVGQWLNDQQAADFLADAVKNKGGSFDISLPSDINTRVVLPDGTTVKTDMVSVIMKPDGSIRTAYPFSSLFPTN